MIHRLLFALPRFYLQVSHGPASVGQQCDTFYISDAARMASVDFDLLSSHPASLVVKWRHMRNQPADEDLYQYYSYYVEYRREGSSQWIRGPIVPYNPDVDPPQATIDGLTSNTEYQVRILGVRSKGDQTDEKIADKTFIERFNTLYGILYFTLVLPNFVSGYFKVFITYFKPIYNGNEDFPVIP